MGMESIIVSGEVAKALNVPAKSGHLILQVSSKGAASKLGLPPGYIPSISNGIELLFGGDIIIDGIKFDDCNTVYFIRKKLE